MTDLERRETKESNRAWLWIIFALLCLSNIAIFAYLLANFAMFPAAPLGTIIFVIAVASLFVLIKLAMDRQFRQTLNRRAGLVPILFFFVLFSYQAWGQVFERRTKHAAIRLDVSEICLSASEKTDATKQHCRQFIAKHGGYLCNVGETPMTRCERELRKVADRPVKSKQP